MKQLQHPPGRLLSFASVFAQAASASAILAGMLGILGWLFGFAVWRSVPGMPAFPPAVALTLALLGIALRFSASSNLYSPRHELKQVVAIICSSPIILMAALQAPGLGSGRMVSTTAMSLLLIATGVLLLNVRWGVGLAQFMGLVATFVGVLSITGYVFLIGALYAPGSMSIPAAVISALLGLGILFARPDRGLMILLASPGAGGVVIRRLLPLAIALPFLIVLLGRIAQLAGLKLHVNLTPGLGTVIILLAGVLLFAVPIVWAVVLFYRTENESLRVSEARLAIDVIERKQIEQKLRRTQDQLAGIIRSATDAIITVDSDQRIVLFNAAAEKMFQWQSEKAFGLNLEEFMPDRFWTDHHEQVWNVGQTNVTARSMKALGTVFGLRADGQEFPIEASISQLESPEGQKLFTVILRDITERRQAERERTELIASEHEARLQAEAANRTKDEFLATLSHELRTPLTAILGWVDILKNREVDKKTLANAVEVINRNAKAQARLIDDLLNVSGITTGALNMEPEWIDAVPLIRATINSFRPAIVAKSIELVTHLDEDVGTILADPVRWQQTLWNLVDNALKFTPKGGRITVDFGRVGSCIQLSVADTGEGIDPAFLPLVFNRFTQADSSNTRRHGGLGLGLALVRHIVELHGGKAMVISEGRGKGSRFIVQLPVPAFHKEIAS